MSFMRVTWTPTQPLSSLLSSQSTQDEVIYPPDMNFEDHLAKASLSGGEVQRAGRWEGREDNSIFRVMAP